MQLPENTHAARLLYLMLFRVGLVTLLLCVLFVTELAVSETSIDVVGGMQQVLLTTVIIAYGLTLVYALVMRFVKNLDAFAAIQVAVDLVGVSFLVLYTGAPDSTFGFAYLLVIVGASTVLPQRYALVVAVSALISYLAVSILGWSGVLLPEELRTGLRPPLRNLLRPLLLNGVAMMAVAALASRLAIELQRAAERIDSQRTSLANLATLHREVIHSLQSGLISVDLSGHIATINTSAAEILGIDADAAQDLPVSRFLPDVEEYLSSADLGAIAARLEMTIHTPVGQRILGVTVSRLVNHEDQLIGRLINFQDLTDLRHAEETAKQADRLAAIGRMAAQVAHEIRNPLAAICGSIELLGQMLPDKSSEETRDLMQIVSREGKRLDGLISDLLSYASPRPLLRVRVELVSDLQEMLQVFANDRRLGVTSVNTLQMDTAYVEVDIHRMRQVVWNLLRNAVEANPGGTIDLSVVTDPESQVVCIRLRDYGPGIPEETRQHLFEPFFTTKESGTGLGLATVHRIVEEHGGHAEIRNVEGGSGAEVIVTLPLSQDEEPDLQQPA